MLPIDGMLFARPTPQPRMHERGPNHSACLCCKKNELHRVLNYHTTLVCLVAFVVVYYIVKNMWEVWYCKRSGWALVRPTVCLVIYPPRYPGIKLKTRNYLVAL